MFKLQVLPLTKQLTNLAGNLWQKSLFSQRAERIEYLLLHEFHNLKYIVPDKAGYKKKAVAGADAVSDNAWRKRKKPAYAGGLVLEPKRGFYDKCVLLLDFNSLYPSIIQEYNICFTTVEYDKQSAEPTGVEEMEIPEAPPSTAQKGILPRLIKTLVDRRRQVKQLLKTEKDPAKYKQLDIRQLALKIMANSMYGCLGFTYSRFYAKPLAALVTYKGRDILQNTMDLAQQKLNKEVIYGDTDSIMVYTGTDDLKEVKKIGNDIKAEVNKMYKLLEIEIDGIMQSMLLLNKKKYAALMITENKDGTLTTTKETKGLDLVRRDWCELSQDAGNYVLDQILSGTSSDEVVSSIHEHMRTVAAHVRGNKVPLNKYIIHKSLTKPPDAYPDAKGLPHVQVAKQLQKRGEAVTVGMHIQYVICKGEENTNFAARAYHPDQILRAEGLLEVDTEWYLSNQIHPPICRLLSPIDGTDSSQLAECLGLDASKFRQIRTNQDDEDDVHKGVAMDDAERFRECTPFQLTCPHPSCGVQFEPANIEWSKRLQCPSCNLTLPTCYIQNSLTLAIRNTIATYQDGWMACEEPTCQHRTRQVCFGSYIHGGASLATTSEVGRQCLSLGCRGRVTREITDRKLYLQLLFLQSIYDVRRADTAMDRKARGKLDDGEHLSPKMRRNNTMPHFDTITEHVKSYLKQSAFNMVSLSNLFNPVMQSRNSTLDIKAEVSKIYKLAK
jgi:DNA polymerase alpha subunit A